MKKPLWIFLSLACLFLFLGTAFFPHFRVWPFAPLMVILFHRTTFLQALWGSFFCGLAMGFTSSQFSFGILALSHATTTLFLYGQKRHFFEDKVSAFSIYSALISIFLSSTLILFSSLSEKQIPLTSSLFFSDLLVMPLLDALYAFLWFTLPTSLYGYIKRYLLRQKFSTEDN
jgi:hypothetical protein